MSNAIRYSTCPHDCPSACALKVTLDDKGRLGKLQGDREQSYTAGTICAKVGRYADRLYDPRRVTTALRRVGAKGEGRFAPVPLNEAIEEVAERLRSVAQSAGREAVWPYHYAGTMGVLQRGVLSAFRHAGGYSGQLGNVCTSIARAGWAAGVGVQNGTDARQIAGTELLILWGTNAASTQINVMTHFSRAKARHGARLIVIDPYQNETTRRADVHLALKPGSDGALACAMMHVLLAEGLADRGYLQTMTDFDSDVEAHLQDFTPEKAAAITGLSAQQIRDVALEYGRTQRTFIRLGVGFSRQRNGAANVHAVSCLPALTGAWRKPGSGALLLSSAAFDLDRSLIEGDDLRDASVRTLDMCRLGAILNNDPDTLAGGPPVGAMLVQNCNPAAIIPAQQQVHKGLRREDLFLCVHEQFLTDTARFADIVLPATMFLEHDDIYTSYGHTFLQAGPRLLSPPGDCLSNHDLLRALAGKLGFSHPALVLPTRGLLDETLSRSGYGDFASLCEKRFIDQHPQQEENPLEDGFGFADGRFRFRPDWAALGPYSEGMPAMPDHWDVRDTVSERYPLRLITPPRHGFLNTTFNNMPRSRGKDGQPTLRLNPQDVQQFGLQPGSLVRVSSRTGAIRILLESDVRVPAGTAVAESVWSCSDHPDGFGINALVSDAPPGPVGGAAFHDTAVSVTPVAD
ncbi:molybdopterin-dependent oxidoreductase [Granulosicoccaceae sp. 1_MG-2023]|nr:molybdopterin-dependent oxidoreductase [Granulosicoccaceae sp. 1_MG-2023]